MNKKKNAEKSRLYKNEKETLKRLFSNTRQDGVREKHHKIAHAISWHSEKMTFFSLLFSSFFFFVVCNKLVIAQRKGTEAQLDVLPPPPPPETSLDGVILKRVKQKGKKNLNATATVLMRNSSMLPLPPVVVVSFHNFGWRAVTKKRWVQSSRCVF